MNKLLILLAFSGLFGCQPKEQPSDVAARASGRYPVNFYVVDRDTLLSSTGINKLGLTNYYIEVSRVGPDSVRVMTNYTKNGLSCGMGKDVRIREVNGVFQLSANVNAPSVYEGRIEGQTFYERTVGMNVDSLNNRWLIDSLKSPYKVPFRETTLSARK